MMRYVLVILLFSLSITMMPQAQAPVTDVCPSSGVVPRPADIPIEPESVILTAFDAESLWVYDVAADTRYPLPESHPCTGNCNLSPDARWLSYLNPDTFGFNKMRLTGTERTSLAPGAADVEWWSADTLLIWTPNFGAYLRPENDLSATRDPLPAEGVLAVQPGGYYALALRQEPAGLRRYMVNLDTPSAPDVFLTDDRPYFNAASWSPDGQQLAYVGNGALDDDAGIRGGEIFITTPNSAIPQQMTYFSASTGAVRINGFDPDALSWSPDSRWLAFWVIPLTGSNPANASSEAVLHLLDVTTNELRRYCGFSTTEHTPNPPRLVWSPDSRYVAFAGNVPGDNKGHLLLALDTDSGAIFEMSDGIFPVNGQANVAVWGYKP